MSVARTQFALSNEYSARVYTPSQKGLYSTAVFDVDASPSMAIAFGAIVVSTTTTFTAYKSTDGINWSSISTAPNTQINAVAYGNNTFVAVGAAGAIYTSPGTDGLTWTARTKAGTQTQNFNYLKFLNGYFWAKQDSVNMMYSSDGITWTLLSNTSFNIANTTPHLNAKLQNLTYLGNTYIFWTGVTASTSVARIYWSDASAISSSWQSRVVTDTIVTTEIQDDPGDGLGLVMKIGTTLTAQTFSRFSREFVDGNFSSSSISNTWSGDNRIFQVIQQTFNSQSPVPYVGSDGAGMYLKYTDGTYFFAHPSQANYANVSNQTGIAYWQWNEDSTAPLSSSYLSENRPKFIPLFAGTTWITAEARFKKVFQIGQKTFIWWGFSNNLDANKTRTNTVMVLTRAIRPLRTTIETR